MLQKLRRNNQKGFTLIELMIVIAIIGILAAIAIPNFIAYRNKSFCTRAESDADSIIAAIANYFAIPTHVTVPSIANLSGMTLSGNNTASIVGNANPNDGMTITVTDGSGRCPQDYRTPSAGWNNARTEYMKTIAPE